MRNIKYIGTKATEDAFFDRTQIIWTPGKIDTVLDEAVATEMLRFAEFEDAGDAVAGAGVAVGALALDPTAGLQIGGAAPNEQQLAAVRAGIGLSASAITLDVMNVGGAGKSKTNSDALTGVIHSFILPAGTVGINDSLIFRMKLSIPSNATTKTITLRTKVGGIPIYAVSATTSLSILPYIDMQFRGALDSQICVPNGTNGIANASGSAFVTTSIDFSIEQELEIAAAFGTAGDGSQSITLESFYCQQVRA